MQQGALYLSEAVISESSPPDLQGWPAEDANCVRSSRPVAENAENDRQLRTGAKNHRTTDRNEQ